MRRFLLIITLLITYNLSFSQSNSIVNTITVKDSLRFKSLWISDISTDGLFLNPKDGLLSSQKAIKTYVDNKFNNVPFYNFTNGLKIQSNIVKLGGILTDSTSILTNNNYLNFLNYSTNDSVKFLFGKAVLYDGLAIVPGNQFYHKSITSDFITELLQYNGVIQLRSSNLAKDQFGQLATAKQGIALQTNGDLGIKLDVHASDDIANIKNSIQMNGGTSNSNASLTLQHGSKTSIQLTDNFVDLSSNDGSGNYYINRISSQNVSFYNSGDNNKFYINDDYNNAKQFMHNDITPVQISSNKLYINSNIDTTSRVLKIWGRTIGKPAIENDEYINLGQLKDSLTNKVGISKFRNGISLQGDSVLLGGFLTKNTNIDLLGHSLNTFSTNGFSGGSKLEVNSGEFGLYANGTAFSYIKMYTDGVTVINSVYDAFNKGLSYASDYSANGKTDNNWIPNFGAVKSTISDSINYSSKPLTVGSNFTIGGAVYSHTRTILSTDAPTILNTDYIIYAQNSAPMTLTLPTAAGHDNQTLLIRATSLTSDAVNIIPQSGETIEGATDPIPVPTNHAIHLIARGTNWIVIAF